MTNILRILLCLIFLTFAQAAGAEDMGQFLREIKAAAMKAGVSPHTIELSLQNFQPIEHVIELDRRQPETTQTFEQYFQKVATESRIEKGQSLYTANEPLLDRIHGDYGVTPSILVSLWGMESSFGNGMGDYHIIPSLATLAYEGRRHDFFKGELIKAMQIVDSGDVTLQNMTGSWAGAMGQVQFMPSTFLSYAVDYNGDGRRDIWHSTPDALASAANYLSKSGWKDGERWGREVSLPARFDTSLAGLDKFRSLEDWKELGILKIDGSPLPEADIEAALVLPDGPSGRAFLAYNNFKVLMRWNHSTYFATTVGLMSDEIEGLN